MSQCVFFFFFFQKEPLLHKKGSSINLTKINLWRHKRYLSPVYLHDRLCEMLPGAPLLQTFKVFQIWQTSIPWDCSYFQNFKIVLQIDKRCIVLQISQLYKFIKILFNMLTLQGGGTGQRHLHSLIGWRIKKLVWWLRCASMCITL